MNPKNSVILVGMPGAGKSTLGVLLAKELGLDFLDTDVSIQVHEGRTLQDIMDSEGYMKLREIEEAVLLKTDARNYAKDCRVTPVNSHFQVAIIIRITNNSCSFIFADDAQNRSNRLI